MSSSFAAACSSCWPRRWPSICASAHSRPAACSSPARPAGPGPVPARRRRLAGIALRPDGGCIDARSASAGIRRAQGRAGRCPAVVADGLQRPRGGRSDGIDGRRAPLPRLSWCAEDGSLAYTGFVYRLPERRTLRLERGWHDVRVLGTHPLVQRFRQSRLLRPELARAGRCRAFPAQARHRQPCTSTTALCAGTAAQSVPPGATVLTLSHSSYAARNPDHRQMVSTWPSSWPAPGRFFPPVPPARNRADYLVRRAPPPRPHLPVECLYLMRATGRSPSVGGMSTTLLLRGC